jgi:iron complex transport system substrate-binding protein
MPRVVSLIASATEIVAALGCKDMLVGRSHECDWPVTVTRLPQVSRPLFPVNRSSGGIDVAVKERVSLALSIYEVNAELLKALEPNVIITQTQCEVCAVTPADVERAACRMTDRPVKIVALEPNTLGDVWESVRTVAAALGVSERGEALVAELGGRVRAIAVRAAALGPRPTVANVEWIEPLMSAGNWMPELVELAGGVNLFGEAGKHSPWMTWEELVAKDPGVLVVSPCGFGIARTLEEMPLLARRPEWPRLRAVREGSVYVVDGNAYFHRPGPRLVESLEILAEILWPAEFRFGHHGTGCVRYHALQGAS